jgi:hypothetical protein
MMALTDDLSDGFFTKVRALCANLGCAPQDMLKVWFSESIGVYADAKNPAGAYGLNQMDRGSLTRTGWTGDPDDYVKLTAEQQLPFIEKYYAPFKGRLTSVARLYQVNFLPATFNSVTTPGGVLAGRDGPYAWAYNANPALDPSKPPKKGYITLDDLRQVVEAAVSNGVRLRKGGGTYKERWKEIVDRLNSGQSTSASTAPAMLLGSGWVVTTVEGTWRYFFQADGKVNWTEMDTPNVVEGTGQWTVQSGRLKMTWKMSEEYWNLPLVPSKQPGEVRRTNGSVFPLSAQKSS